MQVEVSSKDILSSKIVDVGWYRVVIDDVEDRAANDGLSTNSWLKGRIICNADNGDKKFEGVPTPFLWLISSKGLWSAMGLLRAAGIDVDREGVRIDTAALKGRVVEAFIGNELYKGVMQNSFTGQYRPAKAA